MLPPLASWKVKRNCYNTKVFCTFRYHSYNIIVVLCHLCRIHGCECSNMHFRFKCLNKQHGFLPHMTDVLLWLCNYKTRRLTFTLNTINMVQTQTQRSSQQETCNPFTGIIATRSLYKATTRIKNPSEVKSSDICTFSLTAVDKGI